MMFGIKLGRCLSAIFFLAPVVSLAQGVEIEFELENRSILFSNVDGNRLSSFSDQEIAEKLRKIESDSKENGGEELDRLFKAREGDGILALYASIFVGDVTFAEDWCKDHGGPKYSGSGMIPNESELEIFFEPVTRNGFLRVFSDKTIDCKISGKSSLTVMREWVISVSDQSMTGTDVSVNLNGKDFVHQIEAKGKSIKLLAYYEKTGQSISKKDLEIVSPSSALKGRYYKPSDDACLYILLDRIPNKNDNFSSKKDKMQFCARSCNPDGIDATM